MPDSMTNNAAIRWGGRSTVTFKMALALAIVYLVWGSTYLAIDLALEVVPPMLLMAGRFALAGGLLYAWASRRGDRFGDRPTLRQWWQATITGGVLLVGGTGLVAVSMQWIGSGTAALLSATVPVWMALIGRFVLGDRLSPRATVGLGIGLFGVALLVDPSGGQVGGMLLALAGAFAWAVGSLRSRHVAAPSRPMVAAAMEMIGASILFAIIGVAGGELRTFDPSAVNWVTVFAFTYLVSAGSIVAFGAYRWLVLNAPPTLVGTHAYVNPVVAVVLAWVVLGEHLTSQMLLAGGVVLCSLVLVVTGRPSVPIPAQATSGADVYAGVSRWRRVRTAGRAIGRAPAAALRLGAAPVARGFRSRRQSRVGQRAQATAHASQRSGRRRAHDLT